MKRDDADAKAQVIELLPWDLTVRRAAARRNAIEMLDRRDADQAISSLTEIEAYYAVKEIGLSDAAPVLASLEPRQITAMIDIDVWRAARADLSSLLAWVVAFKEASPSQLPAFLRALDPELLALLFRRRLFIAVRSGGDDEPEPDWMSELPEDGLPWVQTADQRFIIAARNVDEFADSPHETFEIEEQKAVLELVDVLYRAEDLDLIQGGLRLAESDLDSALEESAYQFRTGRLEDLGFPPPDRALEVYGPIDLAEALESPPDVGRSDNVLLPVRHATRLSRGVFAEALRRIETPEVVRRIEGELMPLANAVLVADRVEPGDLERVEEVLDRMRAYLELALLSSAAPAHQDAPRPPATEIEIATLRLERVPIRTLFRAGYTITLMLATRARGLAAAGTFRVGSDPLALLPDRDRALVEALLVRRPQFPRVLEDPRAEGTRPFASPNDVERVDLALSDLAGIAGVTRALGLAEANLALGETLGPPLEPPLPSERDIDMLLTTAAAQVLLGRDFAVLPLRPSELSELALLLDGARFPAVRVDRALALSLDRVAREQRPMLERRLRAGLVALEDALVPLAGEIDARFVGVVVRRLDG